MPIIDTHLHLPRTASEWTHGAESESSVQAEILLAQMTSAGVDAGVLISDPYVAPVQRCLDLAALHPDRLAVVLVCDEAADDIDQQIADASDDPRVVGVRISTAYPPENLQRLRAGGYHSMLSSAEKHGVTVCALASGSLSDIESVAREYPTLHLIIDHMGLNQPPYQPADNPAWKDLDQLLALAKYPNVVAKLSGAPTLSQKPYPFDDAWDQVRRVIDTFGVEKCMWGTDQHRVSGQLLAFDPIAEPVGYHSYAEAVHYLLDRDELSESDRAALFYGTASRVLGWAPRA